MSVYIYKGFKTLIYHQIALDMFKNLRIRNKLINSFGVTLLFRGKEGGNGGGHVWIIVDHMSVEMKNTSHVWI